MASATRSRIARPYLKHSEDERKLAAIKALGDDKRQQRKAQ